METQQTFTDEHATQRHFEFFFSFFPRRSPGKCVRNCLLRSQPLALCRLYELVCVCVCVCVKLDFWRIVGKINVRYIQCYGVKLKNNNNT